LVAAAHPARRRIPRPTSAAIDFLIDNHAPVKVVPISIYEDQQGRKFVDIEAEHEPEFTVGGTEQADVLDHTKINGRRVRLTDLLEDELLTAGDELYWDRPQLVNRYEATVTETGAIRLADGSRVLIAVPRRDGGRGHALARRLARVARRTNRRCPTQRPTSSACGERQRRRRSSHLTP
jgi:hypothetical protein